VICAIYSLLLHLFDSLRPLHSRRNPHLFTEATIEQVQRRVSLNNGCIYHGIFLNGKWKIALIPVYKPQQLY
jgi:hypothetical protein